MTNEAHDQEGQHLPFVLDAAIPLWIHKFRSLSEEERACMLDDLNKSDFSLRMEYLLHRGPKGETAEAFNDLAKGIALLSFCPGGVTCFGRHWETKLELQDDRKEV
jgi:hypothetical protein